MNGKIGVISDTHGNSKLMIQVCDFLICKIEVSEIFHLGDNFEDYRFLKDMGFPVSGVPGLWDEEFRDNVTPKVLIKNFANKKFIFAHAKFLIERLSREDLDVWCYGHTHKPKILVENGKVYFNPGHLKRDSDRGVLASYGVINFSNTAIEFKVLDIENSVIQSLNYSLGTITKN
ncbi:MAG: metallophosphoesterase family protein [Candidatus Hydrogenedentes bacterium]|nr:metallophosphoesterase family protein [Candidatus Hydrogenedentota bacterium]